ncbi:hypothetical protein Hanom_Chr04g00285211 [Helianthus anomalus]
MITLIPRTIILLIPSNKLIQPHLKIRRWFIPKPPSRQTNIRTSKRDITISLSLSTTSPKYLQDPKQAQAQAKHSLN